MHFLGLMGMPRRISDYGLAFTGWNQVATVGAFLFAVAQMIFLINVIKTIRGGKKAPTPVWPGAKGLEWKT